MNQRCYVMAFDVMCCIQEIDSKRFFVRILWVLAPILGGRPISRLCGQLISPPYRLSHWWVSLIFCCGIIWAKVDADLCLSSAVGTGK